MRVLAASDAASSGMGIYTGSALGGIAFAEDQHAVFVDRGIRAVSPMLALSVFGGASSCNIAIELGLTGPSVANANSCASGTIAIGEAARLIRDGRAEAMLAGGVEAPLAPLTFGAFDIIRVLSGRNDDPPPRPAPSTATATGSSWREGGATLVLEEWERAERRGARIYAEVAGYATTNDAHHMTAPRPDGAQAARAIRLALADAALPATAIDYVNAHASSTVLNDPVECLAIRHALGPHADQSPSAAPRVSTGTRSGRPAPWRRRSARSGWSGATFPVPRTWSTGTRHATSTSFPLAAATCAARYLLKNSFGFGGINACLVLGATE